MLIDLTTGALAEPFAGRRWSSAECAAEIATRGARLRGQGVRPGDRVLLPFGNRLEFFAELLAIWRAGACAVPIDGRLTAFEVGNLARAAAPRLAVVDDATSAEVLGALADARVPVVATTDTGGGQVADSRLTLDGDALMLFTSGSTGDPKGVLHTHRSLRARWSALRDNLGTADFARSLCLLPTHFGHGLICNALFPWLAGNDLFITPPFRPDLLARLGSLLDDHDITFMSSVPPVWKVALKLARRPARGSLRRVHVGSAPLSAQAWEDIRQWTGTPQVCNAYGITETGSWVAGLADARLPAEDGLIGTGWGATVRVLPTDATSAPPGAVAPCATDEPGFVWLNTPALMKGYFGRDDLTARAVVDGWFTTGDIGVIDRRGYLVLRGRVRDEINKGGMKIYPANIDAVAERHPAVADCCSFAVDDELYGQVPGMALVLGDASPAGIRGLHAWLRQHLAEHELPSRWWVVEAIPRTSRGKLNRDAVKAACAGQPPLDLPAILGGRAGPA